MEENRIPDINIDIDINIENQAVRVVDSTKIVPFKLYKISNVNIYADNLTSKTNSTILDSVSFNNFNLSFF